MQHNWISSLVPKEVEQIFTVDLHSLQRLPVYSSSAYNAPSKEDFEVNTLSEGIMSATLAMAAWDDANAVLHPEKPSRTRIEGEADMLSFRGRHSHRQ